MRNPKFIVGASPEEFRRAVEGARISGLDRRGKFLLLSLDRSSRTVAGRRAGGAARLPGEAAEASPARQTAAPAGADIAIHLKMAGQLIACPPELDLGPTRARHTHVTFHLDDGSELRYVDTRHFGRVYYLPGRRDDPALRRALETLSGLGPEPREGGLEWEDFRARLKARGARIKPLLLDQSFVAGLGNIYADECLFRAGVHPLCPASSLSEAQARALYDAMREVLAEAIDQRGTSVRDYVDGEGRRGSFAERLRVYGRTGQPCPRCGTPIQRAVVAGRGTHFCPSCQREPERS